MRVRGFSCQVLFGNPEMFSFTPKPLNQALYTQAKNEKVSDTLASDKEFVEFIVDQIVNVGTITYRKMFGEYAIYCNGKIVALVSDNQLFVKPTESGRAYIENVIEAPPYPGAKPYFLIEAQFEDSEWISNLIRLTAKELPEPKPQKKPPKVEKQ